MKRLLSHMIYTICFISPLICTGQQNHVFNGGFEDTIKCPTQIGEIGTTCRYWDTFSKTADYFHSCSSTMSTPSNFGGYQAPLNGHAYLGLLAHTSLSYFEYVTAHIQPLQQGMIYEVSMSVSLGESSNRATNNLGVFFFDTGYTHNPAAGIMPVLPQLHYSDFGVIKDTLGWVRLSKSFYADSAYDNIVIGGFLDSNNTYTVDTLSNIPPYETSYYYIDSVVIKPGKRFGIFFNKTGFCILDTITVPYFVINNNGFFQPNNVFTLQLSDAYGSFANPINIGTKASNAGGQITGVIPANIPSGTGYRIRMISGNGADTTKDNGEDIAINAILPVKPVASSNSPVCNGDTLLLTSSYITGNVSRRWKGPNNFTSVLQHPFVSNATAVSTGNYIVEIDSAGCKSSDTISVIIQPNPTYASITNSSPVCEGDSLWLLSGTSSSGVIYTWSGPPNILSVNRNVKINNVTMSNSGWFVRTLNLNGCIRKDSTLVQILKSPSVNAPIISYKQPICIGDTLHLQSNPVSGATYSWTGPGGFSANTSNPYRINAQAAFAGIYNLTLTSAQGCTSPTGSVSVSINPQPYVQAISIPGDSICSFDTLVLSALSNCHFITTKYQWYINNMPDTSGTKAAYNNSALINGDSVFCRITEYTQCAYPFVAESNHFRIDILPTINAKVNISSIPSMPAPLNSTITFKASVTDAGNKPSFQWKRNNTDIPGATDSIYTSGYLNANDVISVNVYSSYKCPQDSVISSSKIIIAYSNNINDPGNNNSNISLYPNPNNGKFTLIAEGVNADAALAIINTLGQTIYTERLTVNGTFKKEIDLQNVATGIYLLRLKNNNGETSVLRFRVE